MFAQGVFRRAWDRCSQTVRASALEMISFPPSEWWVFNQSLDEPPTVPTQWTRCNYKIISWPLNSLCGSVPLFWSCELWNDSMSHGVPVAMVTKGWRELWGSLFLLTWCLTFQPHWLFLLPPLTASNINCAEFQWASRQRGALAFPCQTGLLGGEMVFTQVERRCGLYSVCMYTQQRRAMWHCLSGQQPPDKTSEVLVSVTAMVVVFFSMHFVGDMRHHCGVASAFTG